DGGDEQIAQRLGVVVEQFRLGGARAPVGGEDRLEVVFDLHGAAETSNGRPRRAGAKRPKSRAARGPEVIPFRSRMTDQAGPKTESSFRGTQVTDDGTGPKLLEHRHRLLVVEGPDRGLEVEVAATKLIIGSASANDLVLTDSTVSRRHALVAVEGDRYVLRDLDSTNGTVVDGTPVREAFLAPGARVALGDTVILFQPRKKWERVDVSDADHFGALYGTTAAMKSVFALLAK